MRFSLRLLLTSVVLLCLILGSREALRSYHWHRHLPVEFPLANENGERPPYSLVAEVRFGKANAERVRTEALRQRQKLVDRLMRTILNPNDAEKFGTGFYDMGPKTRSLLQPRLKQEFLNNPDLMTERNINLLTSWIESKDEDVAEYLSQVFKNGDPNDVRRLLVAFSETEQWKFLLKNETLQIAVKDHLKSPAVVEEFVDWLIKRARFADVEVSQLLGKSGRLNLSPATVAKYEDLAGTQLERSLAVEDLLARLRLLSTPDIYFSESLVLRAIKSLHREVVSKRDSVEFQTRKVVSRFKDSLLKIAFRNGGWYRTEGFDPKAMSELADFAYQQNDFSSFLILAGEPNQPEVDLLFQQRRNLAFINDDALVSFQTKATEENLPIQFHDSLPNPRSGFERAFDIDLMAIVLCRMNPEFAKPKLVELMNEGVFAAYRESGELWKGTGNREVLKLMVAKYNSLIHQVDKDSDWIKLEAVNDLYDAIQTVSLDVSQGLQRPGIYSHNREVEPDGNLKELEACFQKFGLKADIHRNAHWHDQEARKVFQHNDRLASFTSFAGIIAQSEAMLEASQNVFEPDVLVQSVPDLVGRFSIEIAMKDCVYGFEINADDISWHYQLCDVYNHILERQRIEQRFLPVSGDSELYFGETELFEQLNRRFGIHFAKGAEFYFAEKGKVAE